MKIFEKLRSPASPPAVSDRRIRVVVIDDHPIIHDALATAFYSKPDLWYAGSASSAEEAGALIDNVHPDVAVVDLSLSDEHGIDLIEELHERHPDLRMVVFSLYDELIYAERALNAGASGYVMKSESVGAVVEAVRRAGHGGIYLSPAMQARLRTAPFLRTAVRAVDEGALSPFLNSTGHGGTVPTKIQGHSSGLQLVDAPAAGRGLARMIEEVSGWVVWAPESALHPIPIRTAKSPNRC